MLKDYQNELNDEEFCDKYANILCKYADLDVLSVDEVRSITNIINSAADINVIGRLRYIHWKSKLILYFIFISIGLKIH